MISRNAAYSVFFLAMASAAPTDLLALPAAGCAACSVPGVVSSDVSPVRYYGHRYGRSRYAFRPRMGYGYRNYGRARGPYSAYRGDWRRRTFGAPSPRHGRGYSGVARIPNIPAPGPNTAGPASFNPNRGSMGGSQFNGSGSYGGGYGQSTGGAQQPGNSQQPGNYSTAGSGGSSSPGGTQQGQTGLSAEQEQKRLLCENIEYQQRIRISCCRAPYIGECRMQ